MADGLQIKLRVDVLQIKGNKADCLQTKGQVEQKKGIMAHLAHWHTGNMTFCHDVTALSQLPHDPSSCLNLSRHLTIILS